MMESIESLVNNMVKMLKLFARANIKVNVSSWSKINVLIFQKSLHTNCKTYSLLFSMYENRVIVSR